MSETHELLPGRPHPPGATPDAEGINFSLFSESATRVELLLFDRHDAPQPVQTLTLDPARHKTFHFWHAYVKGLRPGWFYAYRVDGPRDPNAGHRFNPTKVLLDPYAKGIGSALWNRGEACNGVDNVATSMRGAIIDSSDYDWEGDRPLARPMADSIIYEMHVAGFTRNANSGVQHPGTYQGVIEKIPYLKELGITAVELLPVFSFDSRQALRTTDDGQELRNYWGYSTVGFFAPEDSYCVHPHRASHLNEFRDMVKALHRAGIEVILDVVFNHTDEGNHQGPTISFKGIDNRVYYFTVPADRRYYMDYTGCGNTVNCNHPVVEKFITDCLEFWVREMHVDGFRFDEGSVLSRGEDGAPRSHAPVLWNIELSETFADTKLIAEAWDAAGLYQIGSFPGYRWAEWNGRYRDTLRRFVKGDPGLVGDVATRIAGSADLYQASGRAPTNSINFICCHDGFTMRDLVSYNQKHNEANGENNRDGNDDNMSWNCGVEGDTGDPGINRLRTVQLKNFASLLMLSQGVPMLLSGDEVGRSQGGNNNAYCQDTALSWFDWSLVERSAELLNYFKRMIALRRELSTLRRGRFFDGTVNGRGLPDISWHGCELNAPGWNDPGSRVLAFTLGANGDGPDLHVMANMDSVDLVFALPPLGADRQWRRFADTSRPPPEDILERGSEPEIHQTTINVTSRSTVILLSR